MNEAHSAGDGAAQEPCLACEGDSTPPDKSKACEVCLSDDWKYKCPRCFIRTCSLACSRTHKEESGCSGKRQREAFVAKAEYTEGTFLSDYRLLEQMGEASEGAARTRATLPRPGASAQAPNALPRHLRDLLQAARRSGVELQLMSPGMQRRKANSTRFMRAAQKIFWHVELTFAGTEVVHHVPSVDCGSTMLAVLEGVFEYKEGHAELQHSLRDFVAAGPLACGIKLHRERVSSAASEGGRFKQVDANCTLEDTLRGCVIIEYPRFVVELQ